MRCQQGISLIEVLVAIAVFSIGMLGIATLQIRGAQYSRQAGTRTVVVLQARALAEAMRANPAGVWGVASTADIASKHGSLSGSYYVYSGDTVPDAAGCANQACVVAQKDLAQWVGQLKAAAISPDRDGAGAAKLASVKINGDAGMLTITASWNPLSSSATDAVMHETYALDYQP